MTKLNGREENAIKEATKYQSAKKEAEQTNAIFWVLLSLALVGTVGGVAVCKNKKKFCFAEKDQIEEGGESDKTLFKKEVKSKKAHKKLAKEKLMPAFNVVEQA